MKTPKTIEQVREWKKRCRAARYSEHPIEQSKFHAPFRARDEARDMAYLRRRARALAASTDPALIAERAAMVEKLRRVRARQSARAERKAAERDDFAEAHNRQMWWAGLPIDVREAVSKENGWIGVDLFRPSSERLRELDAEAVASIAEKLSKCRRRA